MGRVDFIAFAAALVFMLSCFIASYILIVALWPAGI